MENFPQKNKRILDANDAVNSNQEEIHDDCTTPEYKRQRTYIPMAYAEEPYAIAPFAPIAASIQDWSSNSSWESLSPIDLSIRMVSAQNLYATPHIASSIQENSSNSSCGSLSPSYSWPHIPTEIAKELYVITRYDELDKIEGENLLRFIEKYLPYFQFERAYSQEKVRSVCQSPDSEQSSGSDAHVDKERKAEYRRENNERSQMSRHKQRDARIRRALTLIFLHSQRAEYERRIQKLLDIMGCMTKKV